MSLRTKALYILELYHSSHVQAASLHVIRKGLPDLQVRVIRKGLPDLQATHSYMRVSQGERCGRRAGGSGRSFSLYTFLLLERKENSFSEVPRSPSFVTSLLKLGQRSTCEQGRGKTGCWRGTKASAVSLVFIWCFTVMHMWQTMFLITSNRKCSWLI